MKEAFNDIIEKDEKIIKVFKPDKKRFWWGLVLSVVFGGFAIWLWFGFVIFMEAMLGDADSLFIFISLMILLACITIALLITAIFGSIAYKNRFYAYSNKRILIRSGVIGVDYRTLEFQALTATNVKVTPLDKILGTNTGTIELGSPSSPIGVASGSGGRGQYSFKSIRKPYDTLREIKEFMDAKK